MRARLTLVVALLLAVSALAADTGHRAPEKVSRFVPGQEPDPAVVRQGGDTIADAVAISGIPYEDFGTTVGYTDDYDEVCPYSGSTAPDVVYSVAPEVDVVVDIDMFGSAYDTKIYLYDADLNLVACNDDFYPDYVSKLEQVPLNGGTLYYLVIDGWNGDAGDYVLTITEWVPCVLECPPGGVAEGEPPLVDEYEDAYNSGCNGWDFGYPFQDLYGDENGELVFCGITGWYLYQGSNWRDTDWFVLHTGSAGSIELVADAEKPTRFNPHAPQDCAVGPWMQVVAGECDPNTMTIPSTPGSTIWFWVAPTTFGHPSGVHPYEYDYLIHFTGLEPAPVATETRSWSAVKGMFR